MNNARKTKPELLRELAGLRERVAELESREKEHTRIVEALRESDDRFRQLFELAPDAYYLHDPEGRFVDGNKAAERMVGCPREELIGKSLFELGLLSSEELQSVSDDLQSQIAGRSTGPRELHLRRKDGSTVVIEARGRPVRLHGQDLVLGIARDITLRREALDELDRYRQELEVMVEERTSQLMESEQKYRAAMEQSFESIYIMDLETRRVTEANPVMQRLLGCTAEEMSGLSVYEFIDHSRTDIDDKVETVLRDGRLFLGDRRYRRRDGSTVDVEVSVSHITYGGRSALCVVSRDITQRRRAEEALCNSELRYRSTLDSMGDAIHVIDRDLRFMLCNTPLARWNRELGLEADVVGRPLFDVFPFLPDDVRREYVQVFETGETLVTEESTQVAGQHLITETRKIPVLGQKGRVTGVVTVIRDITARRRALEGLRESEENYRTLTENVNVGVYRNTVGAEGTFIEANPALLKMFGYEDREAFLSLRVSDLYENPDERRNINSKLLAEGSIKNEEIRLRRRDGTPFVASVSAVAVKGTDGEVRYYDGIIEDITERKGAEKALEQSVTRLRRAMEGIIQAMTIAAELRDPYTAGHQRRVTQLACAIARETGFPDDRIEGLRMAGLIHDIGKMHVPAEILSRPGRLSSLEFGLIRTHPEVGHDILKSIEFPWPIADIIAQHHERMDGSGYPRGRVGEDILLEARILAVADVVEAMSSHRPYRPALGIETALEEVTTHQGTLYDPEIVRTCLRVFRVSRFRFEDDFSESRT